MFSMQRSVLTSLLIVFATDCRRMCIRFDKQIAAEPRSTARKKKGPNDPISIGFSMDTLKEERWQRDKDLVEKRAKELGHQISVQVANGDDSLQIKQAENLLTQGVDVLDRGAAQR